MPMSKTLYSYVDLNQLQRILPPLLCTTAAIVITSKLIRWIFFKTVHTRALQDGSRVNENIAGEKLLATPSDDLQKIQDCVFRGYHISKNGKMLGYRPKTDDIYGDYVWLTYGEVIEKARELAAFMTEQTRTSPARAVVMYKNQPKFIICELACYMAGITVVPLYATLGLEAMKSILEEIEPYWFVAETEAQLKELITLNDRNRNRAALFLENQSATTSSDTEWWQEHHITLCSFGDTIKVEFDPNIDQPHVENITPEDFCLICYTSGTTGRPKGAILTHENVLAAATADMIIKSPITPDDTYFSYLPLAHMYERIMIYSLFKSGASLGFYHGDIRRMMDDAAVLQPTIFPLVPRIINRIHDQTMAAYARNWIFKLTIRIKKTLMRLGYYTDDKFTASLCSPVRKQLGGRVRLMMVGSAPLSGEVLSFARIVTGASVVEGYGQTECAAVATCSLLGNYTVGHTGVPLNCCKIKLVDVPELNYYVKDGAGEICIKGYNVFQGYFKNETETAKALDKDRWLYTGDIGRWNENGFLKIIDRKKNIFKLQQGEYIAPEKIESSYLKNELVAQVFVYGESLKTCLIGIVVPEKMALLRVFNEQKSTDYVAFCKKPEVKEYLLNEMHKTGKEQGLQSFEQVRDIYVEPEPFTIEQDLLTPTMKNKRPQLTKFFQKQLATLYAKLK